MRLKTKTMQMFATVSVLTLALSPKHAGGTCSTASDGGAYARIESEVAAACRETETRQVALKDTCSLADYRAFVKSVNGTNMWTVALQKALDEHEIVRIPASTAPYFFDGTVMVPSNRRIEATGATIRLADGMRTVLLRNVGAQDGTLAPIPASARRDDNIAVVGGRWEDWCVRRAGYGHTGMFNLLPRRKGNFFGVSTMFFFNNVGHVSITGVTFYHVGSFAVQVGDADALVFRDIVFDRCFADGLHLNGNLTRVLASNVRGQVGDDLVALNAYDWLNSSVDFGPQRNILCEDLELVRLQGVSAYRAIRILPAKYKYADGSIVDCAISDVIFRRVKGVTTYKMYMQTPRYSIGSEPEWGEVGSGGNLFFSDLEIDLDSPIDRIGQYATQEAPRGHFAAFEFGANLSLVHFRNIDIKFHADKWPLTHLVQVGPKSCLIPGKKGKPWKEIFDPYVSCRVGKVVLENVRTQGIVPKELVHVSSFDDINKDGRSTGRGVIDKIEYGQSPLPAGAPKDPWSIEDAWRQTTTTRVRFSLNGLWGLRPPLESDKDGVVPGQNDNWGWGKIPSVWSSPHESLHGCQNVYLSPLLKDKGIAPGIGSRAWYRRDFTMPQEAEGRRVVLTFTMLQTHAVVYVDGVRATEVSFPGGEAEITDFVKPGVRQSIVLDVTAYPLNPMTLDFSAPDRAAEKKSKVKCRGVTGDVYLDILPKATRVAAATVECDVVGRQVKFIAECENLPAGDIRLRARIYPFGKGIEDSSLKSIKSIATFESGLVKHDVSGRVAFTASAPQLETWDVHTTANRYVCMIELQDANGNILDAALPFAFGFRDVTIKGRDLLLNEKPIHLRALYNRTINASAGVACKESALEMCRRLKEAGFNFIITGNYNFSPGAVSYMDALLDACDETGMLVSFSLPHARDFNLPQLKKGEPGEEARYRSLTQWCIRRARNHPSVVTYAMNHNFTGYRGDMNPLRIDGIYDLAPEEGNNYVQGPLEARNCAHRLWKIAKSIDSTRPIYHHESGNLDDFHTVNIYLNWAPVQERSDWLAHWNENGVKPLFFVEWGMPHISSWSSYRGPLFIWRKPGFMSLWASEYAAAFLGDAAYLGDDPLTVKALREEESLWTGQKPFSWARLIPPLREMERRYTGVQSIHMNDNWRSHRAWGITAMLPWDQEGLCRGERAPVRPNPNRWNGLKCPGIVPDAIKDEGWDTGTGDAEKYTRSSVGRTLCRWNGDDCAFIGGKGVFTDKAHHFRPAETMEKTLVIMNDRRVEQEVAWICELREGNVRHGNALSGKVMIPAGARRDVLVAFALPNRTGRYKLVADFHFAGGSAQHDEFGLETYDPAALDKKAKKPQLFDPKGLTAKEFDRLGVPYDLVDRAALDDAMAANRFGQMETPLVVGRESLTRDLLDRVLVPMAQRRGRILIFEQTKDVLESVGFRAQTYGLRTTFPRFTDPELKFRLNDDMMRDWNGEATLVAPFIEGIPRNEQFYLTDTWAGYTNTRVWRCGNRGSVATAIPEKPTVGDWRALVDGGFDLQYAPLLDWTIEDGRITFCQLDVTARTVADPVADDIVLHLVSRLGNCLQYGPKQPRAFGRLAWIAMRDLTKYLKQDESEKETGSRCIYVVSSGAEKPPDFFGRIANGCKALCLGLSAEEVNEWSPVPFEMASTNGCFASRIENLPSILNGLSNADWSWHGAMDFDAFTQPAPDGNMAFRAIRHGKGQIVFWQVPPWAIDDVAKPYLRTSKRRAQAMLCRILANMNCRFSTESIRYADHPVAEDDPYRYYRW